MSMVQKRPCDEEENLKISFKHPKQAEFEQISFKHPRQAEVEQRLILFSESVVPEDASDKPKSLEKGFTNASNEGNEKLSGDIFSDPSKGGEDIESIAPGSLSFSSWPPISTSEEDSLSEPPFHMSFFPESFSPKRPVRTLAHYEDIYALLMNYPPRKTVPIGTDHQADVPRWDQQCVNDNISSPSCPAVEVSKSEVEQEKRQMGACIIPMADFSSPADTDLKVGHGRTDCNCEDKGSYGCVRKHIAEAREKLLKSMGPERFMELGFYDMGEQVAQRWSEEEEQTFHRVFFYNPASMGKNFWDKLSAVFPSRTKKEIVSYYFNVFMLRKRAEQNRYVPADIDSDNDEWQGSDDFGDNEIGLTEEDDDSVVESPARGDAAGNMQSRDDNLLECNEDVNLDSAAPKSPEISETHPEKLSNYGSSPIVHPQDTTADPDVQDDSCTSSDTGCAALRNQMQSENGSHCPSSFDGLSDHTQLENGNHSPSKFSGLNGGGDNGFVLEHCDAKDWDVGYMTCSKGKVDFLPTCSMIEEVFGQEIRNRMARDGKNIS